MCVLLQQKIVRRARDPRSLRDGLYPWAWATRCLVRWAEMGYGKSKEEQQQQGGIA
jgi:hypothetical protein